MKMKINHEIRSIYIHIPFCLRKCPYCPFYSRAFSEDEADKYLSSLEKEIQWWKRSGHEIGILNTLYIGGGTPSILTDHQWSRLIGLLENSFRFSPDCEVSVEANPESVTQNRLFKWDNWRVNRISLGVQSLQDNELKWLERPYNRKDVTDALDLIRDHRFLLSCDLMFSLGNQPLRSLYSTLNELLNFWHPEHISTYQLTLEKGTPWGENPPENMDDGYAGYRFIQWYLSQKGYEQYEISSFARYNNYCRHNLAYWDQQNVIGLGPSAWGYINGLRYSNSPDYESYVIRSGLSESTIAYSEFLDNEKRAREAVILSLRTAWGFSISDFSSIFGQSTVRDILNDLNDVPGEYLVYDKNNVYLSPKGMRVGNSIWEKII